MKKLIRLSLLAFLLSSVFLLVGCNKSAQPPLPESKPSETATPEKTPSDPPAKEVVPAATPGDFFPVVANSTWEYQGEGNEYATFNRKIVFTGDNLAQIREDNGGTVSASVFKISSDAVTRIFFIGEAYEQKNHLKSPSNQNLIILKAPLKVGTKWNEPNGTREIVDLNATVATPAGTFAQCLKVKITNDNSTLYEYFKSGIGMVKREFISGDSKVTSSLKNHT
ncbi:MAG TPA: hypothetical protein VFC58_08595 [Desulfosporosinus sp.]|nr:hypothetical protein [Desulfosporosinus sp.]